MKILKLFFLLLITFSSLSQDFNINNSSEHSGGSFLIFRSPSVDSIPLNQIRKPIIWVEGFEVANSSEIFDNYSLLNQNIVGGGITLAN